MNDPSQVSSHAAEIARGDRFGFGRNWSRYLELVDERRIQRAVDSLRDMLGVETLDGLSFLDIGCGSGLFSLAARRLGARVHSFDYDPDSVACARELKRRYCAADPDWVIEEGSVLDTDYLQGLGIFDIVYSWGVLHHTGAMWRAIDNTAARVAPGGRLFIAIYNDQGPASRYWSWIKRAYNRWPRPLALLVLGLAFIRLWLPTTIRDLLRGRPFDTWRHYDNVRGMSPWRDVVDWVGGYPFEVARPEQVFAPLHQRGFVLQRLVTCAGGLGCNEFVFSLPVEAEPVGQ